MRVKQILQYLGICSGDMDKGALRCDANISVKRIGGDVIGVRTELKNLNSFRGVERALKFEIDRQISVLESGRVVDQETMLWDEDRNESVPMRSKEESHDYRYFTEPDLVDLVIDDDWIWKVASSLPELPQSAYRRFVDEYSLSPYSAEVLTMSRELANYVSETIAIFPDATKVANWIMNEVLGVLAETSIEISELSVSPSNLGGLLGCIERGVISGKIAKQVFREMVRTGETAEAIIANQGLEQITDEAAINLVISDVLAANDEIVAAYRSGRKQVFGYLISEIIKATGGKANPQIASRLLRRRLDEV
jgi:aspartyl-tRNA(Asn)/glutamyl-tRNA(Gln) amidotransferase subunit B